MMPVGTTLSRWTMAYFGAAVFFLLFAEILLAAGAWAPSLDIAEPHALIVVHSVTIGWLGLLMIGALLQFAPVMTGLSLPADRIDAASLGGLVVGLGLLLFGFHLINTGSSAAGLTMVAASLTLAASILSIGLVLFAVLWRGRAAHAASPLVLIAIACLIVTAALGSLFAVTVSGVVGAAAIVEFVTNAVPFHASFGLLGWMTFAAIGVSYKLLPMFLLSDDMKRSPFIRLSGSAGISMLAIATFCAMFDPALARSIFLMGGLVFQSTIAAYLVELFRTYRSRRRKTLELNTSGSLPAFALLGISAPMLVLAPLFHAGSELVTAAAYLFVFGWLSGLGLAQLLKIVPFLTWIEAFGPLLGRRPTPRLGDLIAGSRAAVWLGMFYVAVVAAAAAIAAGSDLGFHAAVILQTFATAALAVELLLARALANVEPATKRAPFQQPALFFAANHRGNANGSAS
ncbi:hypothetical protein [Rhizobium sp. YTU87027]|uniref:hypothetical protein n=1 Tax=Rhizobium sp. YTU87027 TaxID=3417741 RepID=UPI003D6859D6